MIGFLAIKDNNLDGRTHHINVDHIVDICECSYESRTAIYTTDSSVYYSSDSADEIIKKINYAKMGIKYE